LNHRYPVSFQEVFDLKEDVAEMMRATVKGATG
jgi:hypothetical protein